jgi:glycogen(starch) synthase
MDYFGGCQERILKDSCFVSAQSRFEMGLYSEIGVPPERIHLSGSGIDPGEFRSASGDAARRRLGLRGPLLLSLTAHTGQRGLEHMLIAFRAVLETHRDAVLVLAGPVMPDATDHLQRLVPDDPLLRDRVVVTGYVRKEERADLLAAADAVLLPSRLDCFGIVLLEAWMSGKPVIGCWSGVMPDLIVEGVNGFLVPFGDTGTLAWRMRTLLENRELCRSMGEAGRSMVLREWTWERITDRFYRRLGHCFAGGTP